MFCNNDSSLFIYFSSHIIFHSFIALLSKGTLKIVIMELPEVITPKQFKYYAETLLCIKFDLNIILKIKTTYNIKRTVRGTKLNIGL